MNKNRNNINVVIMMLVFIITPVLAINYKIAEDRYDKYQSQELEKSTNKEKIYNDYSPSSSSVDYLSKGFWWMDADGNFHQIHKKVKIQWERRTIVLSNGKEAYQFSFLEGAYKGDFGYWSSSFQ
jgi:hypothetical protein